MPHELSKLEEELEINQVINRFLLVMACLLCLAITILLLEDTKDPQGLPITNTVEQNPAHDGRVLMAATHKKKPWTGFPGFKNGSK